MERQEKTEKTSHSTNNENDAKLRVSLLQTDIKWENKAYNLQVVQKQAEQLAGKTDLLVLPEMFSTGFSMNKSNLAETNNGLTISSLTKWSKEYGMAICGSFIAVEDDQYYNRGFFISEEQTYFYDKRHLFRMGEEPKHFSAGESKCIVEHKGFNICLLICYDLRFPVWARNVNNEYDLLIYVANWPESRIKVWNTLLDARAIENLSYVCGVNRVGVDGINIRYNGQSALVDYKGNKMEQMNAIESVRTIEISKNDLIKFRERFSVWKDADSFKIQ